MRMDFIAIAIVTALLASGQTYARAHDLATEVRVADELATAIGGTTLCGYVLDMDKVRDVIDVRLDNMPVMARNHFRSTLYRSQTGQDSQFGNPSQAQCAVRADLAGKYGLIEDQR
jgi:NAD/NADP transhydrogenase beta subunit